MPSVFKGSSNQADRRLGQLQFSFGERLLDELTDIGHFARLAVLAQRHDDEALGLLLGVLFDELLDLGQLFQARAAPGGPKSMTTTLPSRSALRTSLVLSGPSSTVIVKSGGLADPLVERILVRSTLLPARSEIGHRRKAGRWLEHECLVRKRVG